MQDIYTSFVAFIASLLSPFNLDGYAETIALIPILILLYFVYIIVMRTITLTFRKVGMPSEATTGIKLMLRLLFLAFALTWIIAATTEISGTAIVTGGALFGTALGLAFSKALSNMVSGFYVLGARPFRVGDYVKIGDVEGVVTEITLNYTRLLLPDYTKEFVPNSKVVDSQVVNYRVRIDDLMADRGKEFHRDSQSESRLQAALEGIRSLTKGDEVYRYSFDLSIHKDTDIEAAEAYFEEVCQKWSEEFVDKPEIMFYAETMFGVTYKVTYIVSDPMDILGKGSDFTHEISRFHFAMKK